MWVPRPVPLESQEGWMHEIKPLTSLRGFAALAVVMQHFSAAAQPLTPHWIPSLVPHGYMAVHFFFVLSGFIMCLTYLSDFEARGIAAFPGFLIKRVARIVPLNLFVLLVLMLLGLICRALTGANIFFDDSSVIFDLLANIFMLQGLGIGTNLNGPSWSISTEFAAYFLFPLFVALVFHRRRLVSAVTLSLALVLLCAAAMRSPGLRLLNETIGDQVLYCFTEFVLGMGAYILYRARFTSGRGAGDLEVGTFIVAMIIGLFTGLDLIVALLCPFIVISTALNRGAFARALSQGVPYFLGVVSFSIYLLHEPCLRLAVAFFRIVHPGESGPATALAFALIGSLAVIPLAWLTYKGIERPGRQFIRRWAETFGRRDRLERMPG
jgi:peptidoglycan/LPS O-acetylase OafA/YrhL